MRSALLFVFLLLFTTAFSQEICNNGIDDDGDGLIDLNDPQCTCTGGGSGTPTSLIPNPSFEQQDCCPSYFSELNCATSWIQASDATSDYMNTCDFVMASVLQTSLGTFPDGNGAVGAVACQDYKEYVGACLTTPMVAGTSYTIQMYGGMIGTDGMGENACDVTSLPPLQWTIFGSSNCANLPFSGMDCPMGTGAYVELGSATIIPDGQYHLLTITFTPSVNISALVMGPPCTMPAIYPFTFDPCYPYVMVDNLVVNTSASFSPISITAAGTLCGNNLILTASTSNTGGTYQWYDEGVAIAGQTGSTLNVSTAGSADGVYQVVYNLSGGGCVSTSFTVPPSNAPVTDVNDGTICPGGSVVLTATGSTNYSWSPSTGLSATTGASVTASPATTTTYTITSTENGCTTTTTSTVTVQSNPSISVNNGTICPGGSVVLNATPGLSGYTWSPAAGLSATTGSSVTAHPASTTTYTVTASAGGCTASGTSTVTVANGLAFSGSISPNPLDISDPVGQCTVSPTIYSYTWIFPDGTQSNATSVAHTFATDPASQLVLLAGEDGSGCKDTIQIIVTIDSPAIYYVPNTFTPDGDENNNTFQPVFTTGFDPYSFHMTIYNRWGEMMFESFNATKGWDGTYKNKLVPQGSYSWTISFKNPYDDGKTEVKGHVNVLR